MRRIFVLLVVALLSLVVIAGILPGETIRISENSAGEAGNAYSRDAAFSLDGRYVAFSSDASNLAPNDVIGPNIFLRDLQTGEVTMVDTDVDGQSAFHYSYQPSVSGDGRYVAFTNTYNSFLPGTSYAQIYVKDRLTGIVRCASLRADGGLPNEGVRNPSISADGRYVAFISWASDLVPNDTNNTYDVFVHDLLTGKTTLVNSASDGTPGNDSSEIDGSVISADGRYVTFRSSATNLVPEDSHYGSDVYVKDLKTGVPKLASASASGIKGNDISMRPAISADGRYVAFWSEATNLVANDANGYHADIFVKELETGKVRIASKRADGTQGYSETHDPSISADGRVVAFESYVGNLVPDDTNDKLDVFVKDMMVGTLKRASVRTNGTEVADDSVSGVVSADGSLVTFLSKATGFAPNDTNGDDDVFLHGTGWRKAPATKVTVVRNSPVIGKRTTFTANVVDVKTQQPVVGAKIRFSIDWRTLGTATSDAYGKAKLKALVPELPSAGPASVWATYLDGEHGFPMQSKEVDVQKGPVHLQAPTITVARGATATITIRLTNWSGVPLPGRTLSTDVGTGTLSARTNTHGIVKISFRIPSYVPTGVRTYEIVFAGDEGHLPGTGTATVNVE